MDPDAMRARAVPVEEFRYPRVSCRVNLNRRVTFDYVK